MVFVHVVGMIPARGIHQQQRLVFRDFHLYASGSLRQGPLPGDLALFVHAHHFRSTALALQKVQSVRSGGQPHGLKIDFKGGNLGLHGTVVYGNPILGHHPHPVLSDGVLEVFAHLQRFRRAGFFREGSAAQNHARRQHQGQQISHPPFHSRSSLCCV